MVAAPHPAPPPATVQEGPSAHDVEPIAPFAERYQTALDNERLSTNLTNFQRSWRQARGDAMSDVDFVALRARLKSAKSAITADLDRYLARFRQQAERAGAVVHHAATIEVANGIVRDLARRHGVTLVAKSKSMVTEETELNLALAADGVVAVETDLGEWIVQRRHERPSHMVMPAVHLSRRDVAALLAEDLGAVVAADDIGAQVGVARAEIRKTFFAAGLGVTGANALIAESGTVMMCTNEGNGRLCSSLPPVHVVFAGIEKLLPTFADAMVQLRLLGRSGTAQRITSYTTFITGPTPGHELHIVLLDNGRRQMAAMPEFREALHCIRCAACANVCPPYREVGGHVFGHIYTGAIGLVVTPFHHGLDAVAGPQSLCLSCNACETVCPVGIPLPRQILDVRQMVVRTKGLPAVKRAVLGIYARPRAADALFRLGARLAAPLAGRKRLVRLRKLPIVRRQTRWRSLPVPARRPLRDRVSPGAFTPPRRPVVPNAAAGLTVALFPGCMTDRLYPEQGEAVRDVLIGLGVRVALPPGLHCCGLPAQNSGDARHARWMARQTIRALERLRADWIVSGSASCVAMLTQDYDHLFRDEPAWRARARRLACRTIDFTRFLVDVAKLEPGALAAEAASPSLAYHDSCQGLNALGLDVEPRRLLRDVLGADVRDLTARAVCCGFGGSFSFEHPEVAERLQERKLADAAATGATVLVTDNQGCIMHLRGGADARGSNLQVRHLAEVVAERVRALADGPA